MPPSGMLSEMTQIQKDEYECHEVPGVINLQRQGRMRGARVWRGLVFTG